MKNYYVSLSIRSDCVLLYMFFMEMPLFAVHIDIHNYHCTVSVQLWWSLHNSQQFDVNGTCIMHALDVRLRY